MTRQNLSSLVRCLIQVLIAENVKEKDVIAFLIKEKFDSDPVKDWKKQTQQQLEAEEPKTGEEEKEVKNDGPDYDYLLDMRFRQVHNENVAELLKRRDTKV